MAERFFFNNLDTLRFIAFLLVFTSHLPILVDSELVNFFTNYLGILGVQFFFIISGFLITVLLLKERNEKSTISLKKFYFRRILRIFPLYFFILAVILALALLLDQPTLNFTNFFGYYFTFLGNFDRVFNGFETVHYFLGAGVLWSIGVEEQFYLFIPLLLAKLRAKKTLLAVLFLLYLFTLCYKFFVIRTFENPLYQHQTLVFSSLSVFDAIAFGCILGAISIHYKKHVKTIISRLPFYTLIAAIFGIIVVALLSFYLENTYLKEIIVRQAITVLFGCIVLLVCFHPTLSKVSQRKSIQQINKLGKISFGLYIYHDLTIHFFDYYFANIFVILVTSMTATICISWCSYRFLESPFLRYKKRFEVIQTRE